MWDDIVISDKEVEKALSKDGFKVVPMLDKNKVSELYALYEKYFPVELQPPTTHFNSNLNCSWQSKCNIQEKIKSAFQPLLDNVFSNYKIVNAILFIKKPTNGRDGGIYFHIDPTLLIDEGVSRHINLWCPLSDVDEQNGALHTTPGSHVFFPPVHAQTIPFPFSDISDMPEEAKVCVPMKAGEALLFDNRLIHSSLPNLSNKIRVAVVLTIITPHAQQISLYKDPSVKNSPVEVYYQDTDWFLHPEWDNSSARPKTGQRVGVLDYEPISVNRDELLDLIKNPRPLIEYRYKIIAAKKQSFLSGLLSIFIKKKFPTAEGTLV